jgi:hypothetical protein
MKKFAKFYSPAAIANETSVKINTEITVFLISIFIKVLYNEMKTKN